MIVAAARQRKLDKRPVLWQRERERERERRRREGRVEGEGER